MDISEVISIALPIVYVLVGAALIWLVIELVMTVRRTRKTVEEVQKQVEPTLASVERITASLEPVAAKVDPLVERVSLTVDAANLEIMRVDQILEDVNEITDSVSSAVDAVDTVTSAPMELVNNVTNRMRSAFKPKRASDESVALGREKAADATVGDAVKSVAMKNPMRGLRRRKYTPVKNMQMSDTNVRTVTTTEPPTSPTPGISTI